MSEATCGPRRPSAIGSRGSSRITTSRAARPSSRPDPAAATMLATLPGMRFFFDGQMEGAKLQAPGTAGPMA